MSRWKEHLIWLLWRIWSAERWRLLSSFWSEVGDGGLTFKTIVSCIRWWEWIFSLLCSTGSMLTSVTSGWWVVDLRGLQVKGVLSFKSRSNSRSCPRKLKLGDIEGRRSFTNLGEVKKTWFVACISFQVSGSYESYTSPCLLNEFICSKMPGPTHWLISQSFMRSNFFTKNSLEKSNMLSINHNSDVCISVIHILRSCLQILDSFGLWFGMYALNKHETWHTVSDTTGITSHYIILFTCKHHPMTTPWFSWCKQ